MKFFIWIVVGLIFVGCGKKYTCPNQSLTPVFIGYTNQEVDTLVLKRFESGSNFLKLVDSFLYSTSQLGFYRQGDSLTVSITDNNKRIDGEFDYQLIVFSNGRTVSLSEMVYQRREGRGNSLFGWGGNVCISPLTAYKRDGVIVSTTKKEFEFLYIRK